MKRDLRILISGIVMLIVLFTLAACGGSKMESKYMKVEGIYISKADAYKDDEDHEKIVYLFYTQDAADKDLALSVTGGSISIGDNKYDAEHHRNSCAYMPNYYYSYYDRTLKSGKSIKVAETYLVPEADLKNIETITIENKELLGDEQLVVPADDIVSCNDEKEVAKLVDPEGYEQEVDDRKPADAKTVKAVKEQINGYYIEFETTNNVTLEFECSEPDHFKLSTSDMSKGKYEVLKGYIGCTFDSNKVTVYVPYEIDDNGEVTANPMVTWDPYVDISDMRVKNFDLD